MLYDQYGAPYPGEHQDNSLTAVVDLLEGSHTTSWIAQKYRIRPRFEVHLQVVARTSSVDGAKLLMSTSFHPQMDGMTERANHLVGQLFQAAINPDQKDWVYKIPMMEFAINASISESTGFVPFELDCTYMSRMIRQLPELNTAPPGIRTFTQQALQNLAAAHDAIIASRVVQRHYSNACRHQEPTIKEGDLVYFATKNLSLPKGRASKLMPKYVGPYKVLQAYPETSNYTLELPSELVK